MLDFFCRKFGRSSPIWKNFCKSFASLRLGFLKTHGKIPKQNFLFLQWITLQNKIFLSLGSNIGARIRNLQTAIKFLKANPKIQVGKLSSIYETSSVGPKQRDFLNCVLELQTVLSPEQLLFQLKEIEKKMGRKKTIQDGPRQIDLDLILYGGKRLQSPLLTLPHPRFHKRKFVLKPLLEIAPNLKPMGFKKTILQLYRRLTDPSQKVKLHRKQI